MTLHLSRAITLRIATRAAVDRGDDREMARLNALADIAHNALCAHEWAAYSAWVDGPEDAPIRFHGASA
jgi:hypothetical protein